MDNCYTLYLDETKFQQRNNHNNISNIYVVAGIVVNNKDNDQINSFLNNFKLQLFGTESAILHEAEIRSVREEKNINKRPEYTVLRKNENQRLLFRTVSDLIYKYCDILGTIINMSSLENNYQTHSSSYQSYYISLKVILENYTKFLYDNKATGKIVLESRKGNTSVLDQRIRKQYYKILSHGTLRYSANELQTKLHGISFISKKENNNLLQIADFIPRPLALNYIKKSQNKPSIYQTIRKKRYSGNRGGQFANRYGVVIVD